MRLHRQIALLVLGLWVALAPAMTAVPAPAMTTMSQAGMSDDGDPCCPGCPRMDHAICALMCANALPLAIATGDVSFSVTVSRHACGARREVALLGRCSAPDPPPPKSTAPLLSRFV